MRCRKLKKNRQSESGGGGDVPPPRAVVHKRGEPDPPPYAVVHSGGDLVAQVDARIVSNSLTTPTLCQPLPDNGGPLADSSKSIPRSIDRRWRMIPGDGRIIGKANAKADS